MAKKTKKDSTPDDHSDVLGGFNSEVCQLKHMAIDREFDDIKENADRRHEEMKSIMVELQKNIKKDIKVSSINLKDKVVLTEKSIGEKIDRLSDFDDSLKGNGTPGVWESIRTLKWKFRGIVSLLIIIVMIAVGGNFKGVTIEKIKGFFGFGGPKTKQVEPVKREVEPTEEAKLPAMSKD